jgi:hypothetical protein
VFVSITATTLSSVEAVVVVVVVVVVVAKVLALRVHALVGEGFLLLTAALFGLLFLVQSAAA